MKFDYWGFIPHIFKEPPEWLWEEACCSCGKGFKTGDEVYRRFAKLDVFCHGCVEEYTIMVGLAR